MRYSPGTHYFLISLLWRCLTLHLESQRPEVVPWAPRLREVIEEWRTYLEGETQSPSCDEVHLAVVDEIGTSLDTAVGVNSTGCLVYVKMGPFVVLGWVDQGNVWQGTRIHPEGGLFPGAEQIDRSVLEFIVERGLHSSEMYRTRLSAKQSARIAHKKAERDEDGQH